MSRSSSGTRYLSILTFVLFILTLLLQACEAIFTSSIMIPKDIEPISQDVEKNKNDEYLTGMFVKYCSHKKFQLEPNVEPLQGGKSVNESQTQLKKCGAKWFYFASLSTRQTEHKIELFLMQPWSWWSSIKQERFFCSETNDMFDFFKTGLISDKATYKPYAKCPQDNIQQ